MILFGVKGGHIMQQEKMGCLIRELRKEKGMTQEKMAEQFGVTNRTVSRWENGINMPDISILVEMSNYFEVSILELIEGERKQEMMIAENNEELKVIANYADEQKCIALKNVQRSDVIGFIGCIMSILLVGGYVEFGSNICLLLFILFLGIVTGVLWSNIMYASGVTDMLEKKIKKHQCLKWLEILLLIVLLISICRDAYLILIGSY